ncbi:glycosyltransferase 52 family protein [Vibrio sp. 10N.239.311.G01]|uniref:glycosyltransferase 52 family protein n=1 Tax=unclassified Vibrio TaxID=2614977 RepID=UPI00355333DC
MNLFLVTSPFQYICALEAKEYFHCKKNILLLVNQDTEIGKLHQRQLFSETDWTHVVEVSRKNRSINIPNAIKKIKKITYGGRVNYFFYSEYTSWRKNLIIKNLEIEKEIYFDDGTLTLAEYPKYIQKKSAFYRPRLIQDLVIRLNGCKPIGHLQQSENLELFTIFSFNFQGHTVHKNTLGRLKSEYGNPSLFNPDAPIGYIGQGAIGDKHQKSVADYIESLDSLAMSSSRKIIYFPHRTERDEVRRTLENKEYIIYHRSEYPLEIELIDKNIELSGFIGTYSTVMFTCRLLYPDMPIYTISDDYPDKVLREELKRQFKSINIKKINNFKDL